MNQVLKFVIQFVYYHQTVFSNNFVLNIYKITLGSILNSEPFHTKKAGYREKRYRKMYKMVCFTFDIILKGFLRTNYMAKLFGAF